MVFYEYNLQYLPEQDDLFHGDIKRIFSRQMITPSSWKEERLERARGVKEKTWNRDGIAESV